ncbi:MAG: SUKH-4 family immunity protein [Actinomycetaceae bacterium]|nr:SUKH-4 family immunity protein [Actinomycetaceae bacterium]
MDLEFAVFDISEDVRPYLSESDIDILSRQGLPVLHNTYCFRALKRLDAHSFPGCILFAGHPATSFMGVDLQSGQIWECTISLGLRNFVNSSLSHYAKCVADFVAGAPYDPLGEAESLRVADEVRNRIRAIDFPAVEGTGDSDDPRSQLVFWEEICWDITLLDWSTEAFNEPVSDE